MKEKIDFLYPKIQVLKFAFFSSDAQKLADAAHVDLTTVQRWGNPIKSPNSGNITELCKQIKLDKSDFKCGKNKFIDAVSKITGIHRYNLLEEWNKYESIFSKTLFKSAVGTMEYNLSILQGCYFTYSHWADPRQTTNTLIVKALVDIYNYDLSLNSLRVRMLSNSYDKVIQHEVEWDYEGIIICYDKKMVFVLEDSTKHTELVWILANIPASPDFHYIHGILSAGLWETDLIASVPAASRILFKKIKEAQPMEELRKNASRTLSLDDIREEDEKIPGFISNKIDHGRTILTIPLPHGFVPGKKLPSKRKTKKL